MDDDESMTGNVDMSTTIAPDAESTVAFHLLSEAEKSGHVRDEIEA
jgi:hypothetical protein